jgi:aryl-alcohol dehydrogenase-like predicted oxidoreductase
MEAGGEHKVVPRRDLGDCGLNVPVIGVGGWSFGGGDYWGEQQQKDVDDVITVALESGCNFFDTAEAYDNGDSETVLGKSLASRQGKVIIGTKIVPENCTPKKIREHLQGSLDRLQLNCVDIYMIHWPLDTFKMEENTPEDEIPNIKTCLQTLQQLKEEGKIKHIGVSNFGVEQLKEALTVGVKIAVNQLPYGLFLRMMEDEVIPLCVQNGVGVVGYSPLMQGLLTGKYQNIDDIPVARTRTRHFSGSRPRSRHGCDGCEDDVIAALAKIQEIAKENNVTMAEISLAWALHNPNISCIIPGSRNLDQLNTNLSAAHIKLSDETYAALCDATQPIKQALKGCYDIYESNENSRVH